MAIALLFGRDEADRKRFTFFLETIPRLLADLQPNVEVRIYPDLGDRRDIDFAIVWRHPFGVLAELPNLKCISSFAAGVDHIFADPQLPKHIPIVRLVDPGMSKDITLYVVATVLHWLKRFDQWEANQQQKSWNRTGPFNFLDKTVGIMGMGFLGKQAALALQGLGIQVSGWSNSPKHLNNIPDFTGAAELPAFLSQAHALVCILPSTPGTRDILNAQNFAYLPRGAYLINLGRGEHLVEADLLTALASGQLSGACLDVFREEPLPATHPFWSHPLIRITPHIASVTDPATALPLILENYHRMLANQPLRNRVDITKGY